MNLFCFAYIEHHESSGRIRIDFLEVYIFSCVINNHRPNDFVVRVVTDLDHVVKGTQTELRVTANSMKTFDCFVRVTRVPDLNSLKGSTNLFPSPFIQSLTIVKFWIRFCSLVQFLDPVEYFRNVIELP